MKKNLDFNRNPRGTNQHILRSDAELQKIIDSKPKNWTKKDFRGESELNSEKLLTRKETERPDLIFYQKGKRINMENILKHSTEEREHMLKIIQYLNDLKIDSVIPQIQKPTQKMKSLEQVCKVSLDNERKVSKAIDKIINTAQNENDHRTNFFLEWFVHEQIEEEDLFESILQKFDVIGRDKLAIHEIDKILEKLSHKSS